MTRPLPAVLGRALRYDGESFAVQPISFAPGLLLGTTCTLMRSAAANVTEFAGSAHAAALVTVRFLVAAVSTAIFVVSPFGTSVCGTRDQARA